MRPVHVSNATRVLGKPVNWDEETSGPCDTLSILDTTSIDGNNVMVSAWQPDKQDIQAIIEGKPILLWIYGNVHPVVSLTTGEHV